MSDKEITQAAKRPDQLLNTMTQGFEWSRRHSQLMFVVIGLFVIGGGSWALMDHFKKQKEADLLDGYYTIERAVLDLQQKWAQAEAPAEKVAGKNTPAPPKPIPVSAEEKAKALTDPLLKLSDLVAKNPDNRAGRMAALLAADLLTEQKKQKEALDLIEKLTLKPSSGDLLTGFALKKKGSLEADLSSCEKAIASWDSLLKVKSYDFLFADVKLRQGLCYEALQKPAEAEKIYLDLVGSTKDDPESMTARDAEKYLRLLRRKGPRS